MNNLTPKQKQFCEEMRILSISENGKDFKQNTLNDETLDGGQLVQYRSRNYLTGNRRGDEVELIEDGKVYKIVSCKSIRLLKVSIAKKPTDSNG